MKPLRSPQQAVWQRDWQFWFRIGLIAFLCCWASRTQADELLVLTPEPVQVKQEPAVEMLPPPMPLELTPLLDPQVPEPVEPAPPEEAQTQDAPAPGTVPNLPAPRLTAPSPTAPPATTFASEEPSGPRWHMLITPGASSQSETSEAPRLVTFYFDAESGEQLGEPREQQVGLSAAMKQQQMLATSEHSSTADPSLKASAGGFTPHPVSESYKKIYNSIPYSRAEYLANPAYRHEATMELMFGELRPTTVHKHDTPRRIYNLPPSNADGVRQVAQPTPWNWYGPGYSPVGYFPARYPYWSPNSTYRTYPTQYGPLFNRYYRPLASPWGF